MGTRATVNTKDCISCNTCASVCPVDAIEVREDGFAYANDKCISCGSCCSVCPTQCITIESIKEWYKKAKEFKLKSLDIEKMKDDDQDE